MKVNKRISELENQLPYGAKKMIAEIAGVSQMTVTRFFQGKISRLDKYDSILKAAISLIKEYKARHSSELEKALIDL